MLGAGREVAPDRFAITELLLPRARSVERSQTVSQVRLRLAGLLEEPLALLLRLLEIFRDLDAGRSLPREGKAQPFGLHPGLGLAAGELAGLDEFGGDGVQAPGQSVQVSKSAKLLEGGPVGGVRFDRRLCHQFECLQRGTVLSPVLIGISEPLPRVTPRAIDLVELNPALRHLASDGFDGKLFSVEEPLRFALATKHLSICAGTAMELIETALEVCEACAGALVVFPAAVHRCSTLVSNLLSRLTLLHGKPRIGFGGRQLFLATRDFLGRLQSLLETPEPILGSIDLRCQSLVASSLLAEFITDAAELILSVCKPLLCLPLRLLGFGQAAPQFIGALTGREEGRGKHGLPGLEYPADLALEPLRLLDLGARTFACIKVGLHALQCVGQSGLFLQQKGPQLRCQRPRYTAGHTGTQHLVELIALFVRCEAQRRHTVIEKSSKVIARGTEDLHTPTEARGVLAQLIQFGNYFVVTLREQEHVLQPNIRVESRNDERRWLDGRFALPLQVHARN